MVLRLPNPGVRWSLIFLGWACTAWLGYAALAAHESGLNPRAGCEQAARLELANPENCYLLRGHWPYNLDEPGAAGGEVRQVQICMARGPSAKFDSQIQGPAWFDDVVLMPPSLPSNP
jgi:hypothetical protein